MAKYFLIVLKWLASHIRSSAHVNVSNMILAYDNV